MGEHILTAEKILHCLKTVQDPDLKRDIVSLGMVRELAIAASKISFELCLTTPACPLKEVMKKACLRAIEAAVGKEVSVDIKFSHSVTHQKKEKGRLENVKNIIAVASGKGGVGKSTLCANVAVSLAKKGAKVGIIDADIFGPSMPTLFNCLHERPEILEENNKHYIIPIEQYGVKIVSMGLLIPAQQAVVWRGPMASSALKNFIYDTKWEAIDYLFIDLPPGTSDIPLTLAQSLAINGVLMVTTPQRVAIADVVKSIAMCQQKQVNLPILGIVENMAYFSPADNPGKKYYLFGKDGGKELAKKYKLPFLGEVPLQEHIRVSGDEGYPVVLQDDLDTSAFEEIAEKIAQKIAIENYKKQEIIITPAS